MFWSKEDIKRQIDELKKSLEQLSGKQEEHHKEMDVRLDNIEKVLILQEANLKEHMKRSDNLEEMVIHVKDSELKPVTQHVNRVEGALKLIGLIGVIVGIVAGIVKIVN